MTFFATILGVLILILLITWILGYNGLITYLNWVEEAWEQVETHLNKLMHDIPTFVEVIQPHAKHEPQTLEKLIELRGHIHSPHLNRIEKMAYQQEISQILTSLFTLQQELPQLEEDERFQKVHENMVKTETKLNKAISIYNNTVTKYNTKIQKPPSNLVASIHNFHPRDTIEI